MSNEEAHEIISRWFVENAPGVNPKNTFVLFYVSFKGTHDKDWREYDSGRVFTLERADEIASTDGRMWTLRKVHIGDLIVSVWEMKDSRETIRCIYKNESLYELFKDKDYSGIWR